MPKFLTVSPTHVAGKKEYAWNNFKKGGYVSIGWLPTEPTPKRGAAEIMGLAENNQYPATRIRCSCDRRPGVV